ncbi:hypothetical protein COX58_03445 [archaeon CG_4_10_14_0_2_um_filter_Archaea_38_6]|nr:MAG: hypothetical protein COS64_00165 [archaeon CG06_land_8_20_14_3_00_37_11]PJA21742.1 MAG: hypothetical protein COX58_03445 [archaeon CG_4_10_14_0_2_um_filter_Archaea_38_6]
MIYFLSFIMSFLEFFFLLSALCAMVVIYITTKNKENKMLWCGRALVLPLLLLVSIIDLFLLFTSDLSSLYNYELLVRISEFFSLIASVFFLVLVVGKKYLLKFLG